MWRMERVFFTRLYKAVHITETDLAKFLAGIILIDIILLFIWTFLPQAPTLVTASQVVVGATISYHECSNGNLGAQGALFIYKAILILYCIFLSLRLRGAPSDFNERQILTAAVWGIGFVGIIVVPLTFIINSPVLRYIFVSSGIIFATTSTLWTFSLPKVLQVTGIIKAETFLSTFRMSKRSSGANSSTMCPHCGKAIAHVSEQITQ